MHELNSLDNSQLMDLLARHTSEYTKMITDNNMGDDYEKCKLTIKAIQTEIEIRKNNLNSFPGETNITKPPDFS
jgi:hypothetical protein